MNLRSLNFGLDETLIALQDSVAAFCAKEIAPIAQQVDQDKATAIPCEDISLDQKESLVFEHPWIFVHATEHIQQKLFYLELNE